MDATKLPKKDKTVSRPEKLVVKISRDEREMILDYANEKSVNISALVRKLLLEHIEGEMGYVRNEDY